MPSKRKTLPPPPSPSTSHEVKGLWTRVLWWSAWLSGLTLLFLLLGDILAPFLFAALLAWLLNPICTRITSAVSKTRIVARIVDPALARALTALLLTLALIAILVLLLLATLPALLRETLALVAALPQIAATLQSKAQQLAWVKQWQELLLPVWERAQAFDPNLSQLYSVARHASRLLSNALQTLTQQTSSLFALLSWFVLVPFATFYLLKDWTQALHACAKRIPRSERHLLALFARIDETLSALIRGQATVVGMMALFYATLLSVVSLPYGFAIGITAGLLIVLPYVGVVLGAGVALVVAYVHAGFTLPLLLTLLVFVAGQMFESYFLTPRFVGKRIGLHPLWIVFFVLAGGELAGFTGILLALPAGAVLRAVLVHIDEQSAAKKP